MEDVLAHESTQGLRAAVAEQLGMVEVEDASEPESYNLPPPPPAGHSPRSWVQNLLEKAGRQSFDGRIDAQRTEALRLQEEAAFDSPVHYRNVDTEAEEAAREFDERRAAKLQQREWVLDGVLRRQT